MKKSIFVTLLLALLIFPGKNLAQFFIKVPCEKMISRDDDRNMNVQIAKMATQMWETKSGMGLAGPFGKYLRHVYVNDGIEKNELGSILYMKVYVDVILQQRNGKCRYAHVLFKRDYQGGGSYGKIAGGFVDGTAESCKCECANKLTDWLETGPVVVGEDGKGKETDEKPETTKNEEKKVEEKKDGKKVKDGPFETKFSNGNVQYSGAFKDGKPDGIWKEYYQNGQAKVEGTFIEGEQEGMEINYDQNGKVTSKVEYKKSKKNGKMTAMENGIVTSSSMYVDDKLDGEATYYDASGNKTKLETYKAGKLNGPYKEWSNGKPVLEGAYTDEVKDGVWKEFDATGKVKSQATWKEGIKQ